MYCGGYSLYINKSAATQDQQKFPILSFSNYWVERRVSNVIIFGPGGRHKFSCPAPLCFPTLKPKQEKLTPTLLEIYNLQTLQLPLLSSFFVK